MSFDGFLKQMITDPNRNFRSESLNDKIKDLIVDTVLTPDTGKWETGIKIKGKWIIVEMYKDSKEAHKGHEKWCKECRLNPKQEFKSCISPMEWAFGDY